MQIFERDGGCCKRCGLNLRDFDVAMASYKKLYYRFAHDWGSSERQLAARSWPFPGDLLKTLGFDSRGHLWEANHIVGVSEGGDFLDPDNLETLCLPCHKKHTAALRKRLAKK